ncbi:hypothetical protein K469DRAFT_755592 [Zopfia rhizophila CBS 207.26]|uniref:Uncharacterized protein n=1 Tax=Zopfia rhizophila CBS 207.26 TaxID=1314779 RepID=A0A6A6DAT9_9PEZI|nr:hypothetical protein K469DRAFT_755592 [Zopfia rhizophila CBS 207.26]
MAPKRIARKPSQPTKSPASPRPDRVSRHRLSKQETRPYGTIYNELDLVTPKLRLLLASTSSSSQEQQSIDYVQLMLAKHVTPKLFHTLIDTYIPPSGNRQAARIIFINQPNEYGSKFVCPPDGKPGLAAYYLTRGYIVHVLSPYNPCTPHQELLHDRIRLQNQTTRSMSHRNDIPSKLEHREQSVVTQLLDYFGPAFIFTYQQVFGLNAPEYGPENVPVPIPPPLSFSLPIPGNSFGGVTMAGYESTECSSAAPPYSSPTDQHRKSMDAGEEFVPPTPAFSPPGSGDTSTYSSSSSPFTQSRYPDYVSSIGSPLTADCVNYGKHIDWTTLDREREKGFNWNMVQ